MRPRRVLVAVLLPLLAVVGGLGAGGCSVDDAFLNDQLFTCATNADCGDGWGCVQSTPVAADFCAPLCGTEACDGVCTGSDPPLCLRSCRISDGGETSECQSDDFSCVRSSVERADGVCYPLETCARHEECGENEVCLTQLLSEVNPTDVFSFDNLYCLPVSTEARPECPAGYGLGIAAPGEDAICRPVCSITDPRCPIGFACLTLLQRVAPFLENIEGPVCEIGTYGLSCQDDTNCFVGACRDTASAQDRVCTLTCNEASALAGGCQNLLGRDSLLGFFATMQCDTAAPSDDGSGLCVLRYGLSFPGCTRDPGSAYLCADDLTCTAVNLGGAEPVDLCTRPCATSAECNLDEPDPTNWVYACDEATGYCLFGGAGE